MTNTQPTESFQGSDNSSQYNPSENFMRDFMKEFIREFPQVMNELKNNAPDVSQHLPSLSFTDHDCAGDGGGQGPANRPPEESPWAPYEEFPLNTESERQPYNRKEAGARALKENFEDIDVNGDNRLSANEVKKYIRDEVQNPFEANSIRRVLDDWKHVKKGAIDGPGGVSKEDLQVTINKQVQRGVLNRYPAN